MKASEKKYFVIAFYRFVTIDSPHEEVLRHKVFCKERDILGRIYISEQGINGQMSAEEHDAHAYMAWMHQSPFFHDVFFKIDPYHEHAFPKLTIKYRKQLVALDAEADLELSGEHVSPERWKEMLENDHERVLLDVRNDYEWKVGRFEGAEVPPCNTFREFQQYADELKAKVDPQKTPVMMYCTGGIRCEIYSSFLKERGFEKVYQLDGGVINYGHQQGSKHWLGKLFVFDDRLTVPVSQEETPVIGTCYHCNAKTESYYNCANMDCNTLFLCCPECLPKFSGCCKEDCKHSERLRPYQHQNAHKPFRKWYHYFNEEKKMKSE